MLHRFRFPRLLAGAALVGSALPLCATDAPADPAPEPQISFIDPSTPEAQPYRNAGVYAIDRLVMTMITDSSAAVAKHTEVAALATFHLKDVPKKNGTVAGLPQITALKFTSLKVTNPENAPDAAEQRLLRRIRYLVENGEVPPVLIQKITTGAATEWRVYKPLANIRQCGTCHGSPDAMTPELKTALEKKYPQNEGTNYAVGEWRGVIRVTVADPTPAAPKK